ncbi:hypothetical protein OU994_00680 [Pseudoduganella sp. SL102]|uniref:Uncharacterized protein n=1 Tax=Pseudoduganella albidiflava TaxID=321983 RepID=A0A411X6A4_9BURK|nr:MULTISPECIES: hypothetical protein [Pseudoduganella]QBI04576.1 hypothetical protein EYF70_29950 [Pseudoduganella albidiflava]WBS02854.1 hypothetical protein OU994_00680 [Pseudoduganella sp. SL102]GGY28409.1 hypothetical protein GCM10007387_08190 [Pseudoduganella albidiflava]
MADTLLRVFDSLTQAEGAREALIASGIDASAITLDSRNDEAGPVEGNFALDLTEKPTPSMDNPNRAGQNSEIRAAVQRSTCILQVEVDNDRDGTRANNILDRFAAGDQAERMTSRQDPA